MKSEVLTAVKLLAVTAASGFALSGDIKKIVLRRDNGCQASGEHRGPLEAAHYDHTKDNYVRKRMGLPRYDSPGAARLLCQRHHLLDHLNNEGRNGLTKSQNDEAINSLMRRLNITDLSQL